MNEIILYFKNAQNVNMAMFTKNLKEVPPIADVYKIRFERFKGTLDYDILSEKYTLRLVPEERVNSQHISYQEIKKDLIELGWACDYDSF